MGLACQVAWLRGRSLTTLTKSGPLLTTYLELTLGRELLYHIRGNLHNVDIFSTTYLPRLVNVVKERPLGLGGVGCDSHPQSQVNVLTLTKYLMICV